LALILLPDEDRGLMGMPNEAYPLRKGAELLAGLLTGENVVPKARLRGGGMDKEEVSLHPSQGKATKPIPISLIQDL